ncbi:LptM family lipoprotein [Butyrivibrio sp. AC2005]|uniref:LptM family lipoprotein n=1 Tax=Butyrivibrio sp. AC2005 TaxID=1280672 RepID=UPI0003FD7E7F|nr:hypothetical protein [Butyrivibrio sp. AC2005]
MKKLIGAILACVMILSLAGCGNSENETNVTAEAYATQEPSVENDVTGADSVQTEELTKQDEGSADSESTDIGEETESSGSNILSSACPDSTVLDGLAVRGNDAQNDQESVREAVETWVSGLGY